MINAPKEEVQLREKVADVIIQTFHALRRANPHVHTIELEREVNRLIEKWLKECTP